MSKLVNIGSLCIDFVYGVPDIVKSGETLASVQSQIFCGGKGLNQSLAAARAGAEVHHLGAIGDDGFALLDTLRAAGVNTDGVLQLEGPSGQAFIQVDPAGRNAIVISGGSNRRLPASLFDAAVAILEPGDWVLFQNETNDVGAAIRRASAVGAQVALNLAPPDARAADYPINLLALLIVNEPEALALAGGRSWQQAFDTLIDRYPATSLVLTRGHKGLRYYDAATKEVAQMDAFNVNAVDETAAGDAFVGYLLAGLVQNRDIKQTLRCASAAGALAVTVSGAAPAIPKRVDVDALLSTQSALDWVKM